MPTPQSTPPSRLTTEETETILRKAQQMLTAIRPHLRPVLAADLQERILSFANRLRELRELDQPAAPPTVTRPRLLPQPLNPFFFVRAGAGDRTEAPGHEDLP